jgi:hypothetical protein
MRIVEIRECAIPLIAELERELAEARLKLLETDTGSLFDLKNDKAEDIVHTILATVVPHRAEAIARGLLKGVKRKGRKPAG